MRNKALEAQLNKEISEFIDQCMSLHLASLTDTGAPYASYAPFAMYDNAMWVLISELAIHAHNLQLNSEVSTLLIEDEQSASNLFARVRVNYTMQSRLIERDSNEWALGLKALYDRHGEMIKGLSQLTDFKLFRLTPIYGRFVKGFGQAYELQGSLTTFDIEHLRDGHRRDD